SALDRAERRIGIRRRTRDLGGMASLGTDRNSSGACAGYLLGQNRSGGLPDARCSARRPRPRALDVSMRAFALLPLLPLWIASADPLLTGPEHGTPYRTGIGNPREPFHACRRKLSRQSGGGLWNRRSPGPMVVGKSPVALPRRSAPSHSARMQASACPVGDPDRRRVPRFCTEEKTAGAWGDASCGFWSRGVRASSVAMSRRLSSERGTR